MAVPIPVISVSLEALRMHPYGKNNQLFSYASIAKFLESNQSFILPQPEKDDLEKVRVFCIDEGIVALNPRQIAIPLSGAGAGIPLVVLHKILDGVGLNNIKLKPHCNCGKAELVLSQKRALYNRPIPTPEEVDRYAQKQVVVIAEELAVEYGRMIGQRDVNEPRKTEFIRPSFHPADGAYIALSKLLPHNLLSAEVRATMPMQFTLAGHYYADHNLHEFASSEMFLSLQINSGDHGLGIIERGFTYTALIDANDKLKHSKLNALTESVWSLLKKKIYDDRTVGPQLNQVFLDIVEYRIDETSQTVSFNHLSK